MMKEQQKIDSQPKISESLKAIESGQKVARRVLGDSYKNEWYRNNFPISPDILDCRNCCEHEPPEFGENCVKCTLIDAHVLVSKAEECTSFSSWMPIAQPKLLAEPKRDEDYPNLQDFFSLAEQLSELDEVIVEEKQDAEWTPNSSLDAKVFGFNDENVSAALRAIFEILRGMSKRLESIEDKMPTTRRWKLKDFLKGKKEKFRLKRVSWKWKIIFKIRAIKKKKPKEPLKSLAALFKVESKNKTEEETKAE